MCLCRGSVGESSLWAKKKCTTQANPAGMRHLACTRRLHLRNRPRVVRFCHGAIAIPIESVSALTLSKALDRPITARHFFDCGHRNTPSEFNLKSDQTERFCREENKFVLFCLDPVAEFDSENVLLLDPSTVAVIRCSRFDFLPQMCYPKERESCLNRLFWK